MAKSKNDDSIYVSFVIPGNYGHLGGYLPKDKVYEYLEKLTKQDTKSEHCALYSFVFSGFPYAKSFKQQLMIKPEWHVDDEGFVMKSLCLAPNAKACFRNIKTGKCRDPFIVKNIGEVFWPDKYAKQR